MKRKRIILLAVLCGLALLTALLVYERPRSIRWNGEAENLVNGISERTEIAAELKEWRKLFRATVWTGSVTLGGKRFEDVTDQRWIEGNPFIPVALKETLAGNQLRVYEKYLSIRRNGNTLQITYTDAVTGTVRSYELPLNQTDR